MRRNERVTSETQRRIEHFVPTAEVRRPHQRVHLSLPRPHQPQERHPDRGAEGPSAVEQIGTRAAQHQHRRASGRVDQLGDDPIGAGLRLEAESRGELLRLVEAAARGGRDQAAHGAAG